MHFEDFVTECNNKEKKDCGIIEWGCAWWIAKLKTTHSV